jgi:phosphoribosylcarboxyaminoimidazole (NCAIR) mutase
MSPSPSTPLLGIVMGSASDWPTLRQRLEDFRLTQERQVLQAELS